MTTKDIERWLSAKQAAELLSLSVGTLANWRSAGTGPQWTKFGRAVRYNAHALKQWANAEERLIQTPEPQPQPEPQQDTQHLQTTIQQLKEELIKSRLNCIQEMDNSKKLRDLVTRKNEQLQLAQKKINDLQRSFNDERRQRKRTEKRLTMLSRLSLVTFASDDSDEIRLWQFKIGELLTDPDGEPFIKHKGRSWFLASTVKEFHELNE